MSFRLFNIRGVFLSLPTSPSPWFTSRPPWLLSLRTTISPSSVVTMPSRFPNPIHFHLPCNASSLFARKRGFESQEIALEPSIIEELADVDEDNDFDDEQLLEDNFENEYLEDEEAETRAGDEAGGGEIAVAGTSWDKEALSLGEQVCDSFDGQLTLYTLRTLANFTV